VQPMPHATLAAGAASAAWIEEWQLGMGPSACEIAPERASGCSNDGEEDSILPQIYVHGRIGATPVTCGNRLRDGK
jgi:hypothetical protein